MPTETELRALALTNILGPNTQVIRRCDIYESDAETIWLADVGVEDANISVDSTRAERRIVDAVFSNVDGSLDGYPGGFWYDKVLKFYRGVELPEIGATWETQVGEFYIDTVEEGNFPHTSHVTARDYSASLAGDKFPIATAFAEGQSIETVVHAIASNGGVEKFKLDATGKTLGSAFFFDADTSRWDSIVQIATAFGYDVFFDSQGYLVLREFRDPSLSPTIFTFETGAPRGSIAAFSKQINKSRIYNHVVVVGEATGRPSVWAEAENTDPSSPSHIRADGVPGGIERRTYRYSSSFITTTEQAQSVANAFLAIHSLQEFNVTLETLVIPWLEAAEIIDFIDPDPAPGDPERYLLSSFSIPWKLGTASLDVKRVTLVG